MTMKNLLLLTGSLLIAANVFAEQLPCDCEDCRRRAALGKPFTMPELDALNPAATEKPAAAEEAAEAHDHEHEGHDHDVHSEDEHPHDPPEHDQDEAAHDHGATCASECATSDAPGSACAHGHDEDEHGHHDDAHHDHGEAGGVVVTSEMAEVIGLSITRAAGGAVAQVETFPAEIRLNRDRNASVRAKYASKVREVAVEIGDKVRQGDRLAVLENLQTLARYDLTAPLDGVVITKDVAVGETAGTQQTLFAVADLSSVWADISIFPKYQHTVRAGMPVRFVATDGHTAGGVVSYVSPLMSRETRTFTARCVLQMPREDFTPGAFVRAQMIVAAVDAEVRVPNEAVQSIDGEAVVFVPGEAGYITREVHVGLQGPQYTAIVHGLKPGEPFVASGAFALKAEMVTSGMDPHAGHGH
jgi:cobalt-zinc-cadmium efflux system membrane fusion protein